MRKILKLVLTAAVILPLIFGTLSCGASNLPPDGENGGGTEIGTPDIPNGEIKEPANKLPELEESALIGEADKAGAAAVVTLKGDTADFIGENVKVTAPKTWDGGANGESAEYGTVIEISKSGTYVFEGTLNDGFIAVSKKDLDVTIVLNGVNIFCKNFAAVASTKKSAVTVVLSKNSSNYLTDGGVGADEAFVNAYDDNNAPNAALFVRTALTIEGEGKLTVNGGMNNGIGSRGTLTVNGGDITVNAVKNAVKGNDALIINGGKFNLSARKDAVKSEADESDPAVGFIAVNGGEFLIYAANDAVQAGTDLTVKDAVIKIKTGGGSDAAAAAESAKGLKAGKTLTIESGRIEIDSNDDALHSNGTVVISGGTLILASADDGIHADSRLTVSGGSIDISKSYEGLESLNVDLSGGTVKLLSADDGVNISGGKDSSAAAPNRPGIGGGRPGQPQGGGAGAAINGTLTITGGFYMINSSGDGLDSNGGIVMSGGTVVVYGPTNGGDVPIDYDGTFTMTGGTITALGTQSNMAQQPAAAPPQYSFMTTFGAVAANTLLNVTNAAQDQVLAIKTLKTSSLLVVCSPLLTKGTVTVSKGGSYAGGTENCGLYLGGSYSGGTVIKTLTI